MADLLKQQGNAAFAAKDWDSAIDLFGQAIALDPSNHVLFSNRSAAYAGKKDWDNALKDAEQVSHFHFFIPLSSCVDPAMLIRYSILSVCYIKSEMGQRIC
ncbi:hypothetical protein CPB86DRAFT_89167 [Serendipita vermifera]|nr:hypothetical protein CPB86DRAFT_89167 [Serendipita vermifera]